MDGLMRIDRVNTETGMWRHIPKTHRHTHISVHIHTHVTGYVRI